MRKKPKTKRATSKYRSKRRGRRVFGQEGGRVEWPDFAIHAVVERIGNCWSGKEEGYTKVTASRKGRVLGRVAGRGGRRPGGETVCDCVTTCGIGLVAECAASNNARRGHFRAFIRGIFSNMFH